MFRATAIAILLLIPSHPAQSLQVSCDDVRAFVAEHGKTKAIAFAIQQGATWSEIMRAKRCLTYAQAK